VQLIRFADADGAVGWGIPAEGHLATPLAGGLFGDMAVAAGSVRVARRLAPIDPPNIFAIGRNYREHADEMKATEADAEPLIFLKATTSIIGPDDCIVLPRSAPDEVDFEGELAVIIGAKARDVSEAQALEYVLGYCCANDVSARDCQKRRDKQWARGKSFDTFCPLGPGIITRGSLNAESLRIRTILNHRTMQEATTADMVFSVPFLVSYLSRQFTLLPGTVILTGTPGGVGFARSPQVFLRPGDEVTVEIEGIGALTNRVVTHA
jgi:2-keto-4-pentenoate hydratase/2-oxohepta-3-ene-1,7-dioic acid hydratase in catechol pathway